MLTPKEQAELDYLNHLDIRTIQWTQDKDSLNGYLTGFDRQQLPNDIYKRIDSCERYHQASMKIEANRIKFLHNLKEKLYNKMGGYTFLSKPLTRQQKVNLLHSIEGLCIDHFNHACKRLKKYGVFKNFSESFDPHKKILRINMRDKSNKAIIMEFSYDDSSCHGRIYGDGDEDVGFQISLSGLRQLYENHLLPEVFSNLSQKILNRGEDNLVDQFGGIKFPKQAQINKQQF